MPNSSLSLNELQELRILYKSTEIEQKTSMMGIIFIKIQFHLKVYTRNKNEKGRWT